ncbi:MAG TPA: CRTAC1 family protein [Pyrinomonadaceae bacterium]|nr:CRTAC1 family protein [Pyrinomonadaceae bacterium]
MSAVAHIKDYKAGKFFRDEFRGDSSWNGFERNVLLRNEGAADDGTPRFADVAMATGADDIRDGRGMAVADFDNDGDLDIVVNNGVGDSGRAELARAVLLRNDVGSRRNWLAVELRGAEGNRDAVGATVTIESGVGRQLRLVTAGSGYASQHSARLYFGLGDETRVPALVVRWPNNRVERFENLEARQLIRITEGGGVQASVLPGAGL